MPAAGRARRDEAKHGGKNLKIKMLPLALLLGLLALSPFMIPAHATADFTISANPSNLGNPVTCCVIHHVTINVTSTGGFSGSVSLSESDNGGITPTFNPTSVTVSSGGFATSRLSLAFGDCGQFGAPPITVTGTSGSLQHSVYITYGPKTIC